LLESVRGGLLRILLTNDDGVLAEGLRSLAQAVRDLGEVLIVAPEREQSAASRALTLDRPLRVRRIDEGTYSVDGTPTDSVLLAVRGIPGVVSFRPDLIVSGINHGPNLGDDVVYSGTVAAAAEGSLMGIPALAVSLASWSPRDFRPAAAVTRRLIGRLASCPMTPGTLLNVNIPEVGDGDYRGVRITRLGKRVYPDLIVEQRDPRGKACYWIGGEKPSWEPGEGSDFGAVEQGYISITPLHLDLTHHARLDELASWNLSLD
jgi:5'-nucleotidase